MYNLRLTLQVPGRMGLLITLCLINFNIYGSVSSTLAPPKRGFCYIELWMVGVMITIIFAILEYLAILAFKRKNGFSNLNEHEITKRIDSISLIMSFRVFILFNVIYWLNGFGYFWNFMRKTNIAWTPWKQNDFKTVIV